MCHVPIYLYMKVSLFEVTTFHTPPHCHCHTHVSDASLVNVNLSSKTQCYWPYSFLIMSYHQSNLNLSSVITVMCVAWLLGTISTISIRPEGFQSQKPCLIRFSISRNDWVLNKCLWNKQIGDLLYDTNSYLLYYSVPTLSIISCHLATSLFHGIMRIKYKFFNLEPKTS